VALLASMSLAEAAQLPPGCTANKVGLDIQKSASGNVVNGAVVTYTIVVGNGAAAAGACNAINNTIQGFCPDGAGNPTTPASITVVTPLPNPLVPDTADFTYGRFNCTINVNPGVTVAQASDQIAGLLQDNPAQDDPYNITKTVSVNVVVPNFAVNKTCI